MKLLSFLTVLIATSSVAYSAEYEFRFPRPRSPSSSRSVPVHFCSIDGPADSVARVFKRHVKPSDRVRFLELGSPKTLGTGWARQTCSPKLRCDVLIVNTDAISASVQELFSQLDRERCEALTSQPVQVFLVGSDTLSHEARQYIRSGRLFTSLTVVYGFDGARPTRSELDAAIEDFVSSTDEYLGSVRSRITAREARCFQYRLSDLPLPRALAGAEALRCASWITGTENRLTASLPQSCPKISK